MTKRVQDSVTYSALSAGIIIAGLVMHQVVMSLGP